ncbi:MAG: LacI family DNA-binding transcriptional regulator [Armatimonadota bacterium]
MNSVRQLAKLAGVSKSTVSRALRNDPHVRPDVRQHIIDIAFQFQCCPDQLVRSLVAGKSGTIGILIPRHVSPFFSHVLHGVLHAAFAKSYHVIPLLVAYDDPVQFQLAIHALLAQRVDSIILSPLRSIPIPPSVWLELRSQGVIPIGIDLEEPMIDIVRCDEAAIGETVISYLWDMGHREIAYIGPITRGSVNRTRAVAAAMRHRGLSTAQFYDMLNADQTFTDEMFARLWVGPVCPTAVVAFEDGIAAQIMQRTLAHGMHIPADFSIISCGNYLLAPNLFPPLTSVEHHAEEIGQRAFSLFLQRISDLENPAPISPRIIVIPHTLIERSSCAPPSRRGGIRR